MDRSPRKTIDYATGEPRATHATPSRRPAIPALPAWNALLLVAGTLAVRIRRAGKNHAVTWTLAARRSAVSTARRLTALRLAAWDLREHIDTTQRLVAALVTDALDYAADGIKVTLNLEDGLLRCEVEDAGSDPIPARHNPLAARLACCSGVADSIAWFELVVTAEGGRRQRSR